MPFTVEGKIGERWRRLGAAEGAFGPPLGPEENVSGRNGRRQRFERGEIAWSPDQDMTVSVYRLRNEACLEWSPIHIPEDSPVSQFLHYNYDILYNGVKQGHDVMGLKLSGVPRIWTRLQGFGEYAFIVRGWPDLGFTLPVRVQLGRSSETPNPGGPNVGGLIEERWHELGAWSGPLGKPTGEEDFNPDGGIRNQEFENAVYQRGRFIELNWGGADTSYNAFRVDVTHNGAKFLEKLVWSPGPSGGSSEWARPGIGAGQVRLDAGRGNGIYTFRLYPTHLGAGATNPSLAPSFEPGVTVDPEGPFIGGLTHGDFPFGSTQEILFMFVHDAFDAELLPPAMTGAPARAFASHIPRVRTIARRYARTQRLMPFQQFVCDENIAMAMIAHLQAVFEDHDFTVPGELPSRILAHAMLGQFFPGKAGTNNDYDFALKGLIAIAYRYRDLLTEEALNFILHGLVTGEVSGRPNLGETLTYRPPEGLGVPIAPESENHVLMIFSIQYLANQLLFDQTGDREYNNNTNGLTKILLDLMHAISKHDFLEFNSRPYHRLSIHAILNLYEFARDDSIRTAAQILLDYTMVKFAVSSNRLRRICPFRRLKEYTNLPNNRHNELLAPQGEGNDALIGFFLMYAGPTDINGAPTNQFLDGWTQEALIAGLGAYRPPPAAYIIAMTRHDPAQHRFYHGKRPHWSISFDEAEGGVEIYYSSPSFLLTAGGMFLNSGYGFDELFNYKDTAIAQATTLLPTRTPPLPTRDLKFADLIRFDRYPDERDAVNTGVHLGFACGANLRIPDMWLQLAVASWDGPWLLLDLNNASLEPSRHLPDRRLGFYVAIYRTPVANPEDLDPAPDNLGLLYAMEASVMSFEEFKRLTKERNTFPDKFAYGGRYVFHSADDRRFKFWLNQEGDKYEARVTDEPGPIVDLTSLPLVDGPYLTSLRLVVDPDHFHPGGHGGYFEIRYPDPDSSTPLILDFRDPKNPIRLDNITACPKPLFDRALALIEVAGELWDQSRNLQTAGKIAEAVVAAQTAVDVQRGFTPPPATEAAYQLRFGRVLQNLAYVLIAARRFDKAEVVAKEAVEVLLAAAASGADLYECASEIMALSGYLALAAKTASAVVAAQKAVDLLRRITPSIAVKAAHWWWFGKAWEGLALNLILDGRVDEAVRPASEAVGAYRVAAASGYNRTMIHDELARMSGNLADAGKTAEAAAAAQAADEILRGG
jgi:tetratricopeptide (TPR) repeat protein